MHKVLAIAILCFLAPFNASSSVAKSHMPNAKLVGSGELKFMLWNIYEAKLFAPNGKYKTKDNFSLKLKYFRDLKGIDIAERSIQEIKTQGYSNSGKLKEWRNLMNNIFPDVTEGSILEGVFLNGKTIFYYNNIKIAEINDKEFGIKFFDIWLSPETTEPKLRKKLLGLI